ncbi:GNAT family N-acetyltransferase [Paenibacillus sp. GCM10012306]|uniref:GNAT family N-acetyltransferase n=1 Tax=Paenibacillus sp. GCM10012306 TaxID=3317342 RepID=UPI00361C24C8
MSTEPVITLVDSLTPEMELGLSEMLIRVVDDGASIGFLPPLDKAEALDYWRSVPGPGVLLWIAWEGDAITGTIQLQLARKANALHRAEIAKLMVHPDHRRKGIAGRLMDTAEAAAAAEGRELLTLDTREGDPSNLLYQSRGFIEAGRIPYFARSGDGQLHTTVLYYKKQ